MGKVLVAVLSISVLLLLGLLAVFILNFSEEETMESESSMQGLVAQIEGQQILVLQGVTAEQIVELDEQELIATAGGAAYFVLSEEETIQDLKVGMEVRVWYDKMDTSFPASGVSTGIEIVE
jgi:hypothetical protein